MTVPADAGLPALVLSVPTGDDIDRIAEICQEADIQEWTVIPRGYQRSDAQVFVERIVADGWSEGGELTWAVREVGDDVASPTLVGMLSITLSGPEGARTGEIGYWLTAAARGRGTMTRAVAVLIDAAFDPDGPLGLSALRWRCDIHDSGRGPVPNWASWKVAWSLGFQREGRVRRFLLTDGRLHDGWVGTLLPEDPREPQAPWDGPIGTGGVVPLVAHNGVGEREGDDPEALVRRFHRIYGLPVQTDGASLERESLNMRMSLIAEEFAELVGAVYGQAAMTALVTPLRPPTLWRTSSTSSTAWPWRPGSTWRPCSPRFSAPTCPSWVLTASRSTARTARCSRDRATSHPMWLRCCAIGACAEKRTSTQP